MHSWARKIELAANVAIIVVAIGIGVVLIRASYLRASRPQPDQIVVGSTFALEGVDWEKNQRTLFIALKPGCPFCASSAAFYRSLSSGFNPQRKPHLVALVPEETPNANDYPKELAIVVDEIRQTSMAKAKIAGTPTLVLVNSAGVVEKVWPGKLSSSQEKEVVDYLGH
jgi:hypothetical protein